VKELTPVMELHRTSTCNAAVGVVSQNSINMVPFMIEDPLLGGTSKMTTISQIIYVRDTFGLANLGLNLRLWRL